MFARFDNYQSLLIFIEDPVYQEEASYDRHKVVFDSRIFYSKELKEKVDANSDFGIVMEYMKVLSQYDTFKDMIVSPSSVYFRQ